MKKSAERTEALAIELDPVIAIKCGDDQNRAAGILYFLQRGVNNLSVTSSNPSLFLQRGVNNPMEAAHD